MYLAYTAGFANIAYDSDATGFSIRGRLFSRHIPWDRLIAGGILYQNDPSIAAATPLGALPFFGYLIRKSEQLIRTTRRLWLASRTFTGRTRIQALTIPLTPEGDAILHELRTHCPQWTDEPQHLLTVRRSHGVSNASAIALTIGFVFLIGFLLLLLLFAWAFAMAGLQWLAIKFWWILLFGLGFYWVYRKLKNPTA